jgi:type IX secretion system PorP/SprF family membrane protein
MKNLFTIALLAFCVQWATAQDEAVFTHYHINPILINPAHAGFADVHHIQMNLRNQWSGFPGAPSTYMVNYNGPIGKTLGVGLNVLSEEIAQISRVKFGLNYAFRFKADDFNFALGFSTEFQSFQIANSVLDQPNPIFEPGDPIIMDGVDGRRTFDATLGFFGTYKENTFFGLSFPKLVSARIGDDADENGSNGSVFQSYIFQLGNHFDFEGNDISLTPSILVRKIQNIPFQVDLNLVAGFVDDKIQTGLAYRSGVGGAVGLLLGTKLPPFSAYYSYDVSFQGFQQYNNGSHELTVAFDFSFNKDKKGKK